MAGPCQRAIIATPRNAVKEPALRILQIYKDYFPVLGGIENHLRVLSEGLAARGHEVTVLVTSPGRTSAVEQHGRLRVIKAGRLLHLASTPLSLAQLQAARATAADVVHLHFPYPPGDLAYFFRARATPLVVTYHSDIVRQRNLLRVYRPLQEQTLRRAARILPTNAPYIASSGVLRRFADKCTIVPLSVDAARFAVADVRRVRELRARYGGPLALFVGRLRYYKGLHLLIEAMQKVDGRLLIVGSGPEDERLRRQAQELGLDERVLFAGEVSDAELPAYYGAADVFVLPGHLRAEAFGIVQLEAMAAGLPLISTELGTGTSYVNQHGVTGFVVAPGSPHALAQALRVLFANPALRRSFGQAGKQRAAHEFSPERMIRTVEQVYDEVTTPQASSTRRT